MIGRSSPSWANTIDAYAGAIWCDFPCNFSRSGVARQVAGRLQSLLATYLVSFLGLQRLQKVTARFYFLQRQYRFFLKNHRKLHLEIATRTIPCLLQLAMDFFSEVCQTSCKENFIVLHQLWGRFPVIAETTGSELASTLELAEQFPVIWWIWQFIECMPNLSFKQIQLNDHFTNEHANTFFSAYPTAVFSHLFLQVCRLFYLA